MAEYSMPAAKSRLLRTPARALRGALGCGLAALVFVAVPAQAAPANRSLDSVHQPVVTRTDFVFDTVADASGRLSGAERARLLGWFEAINLGFGDRVTIIEGNGYNSSSLRDAVADEVAHYGLLIADDDAPQTAGLPASGSARIVISRALASVPSCPDWNDRNEPNLRGGLSRNYGCATASNLAAMVADPQDLVEGRSTHSVLRTATSNRAIKAYGEQVPTGAGGALKAESVGGR